MGQEATKEKKSWKKGWWWKLPVGLIGAVFLIDAVGSAGGGVIATELPACDSATAEKMVKGAVKNNPMSAIVKLEILAFQSHEEVRADKSVRQCASDVLTNAGATRIAYDFKWVDKAKGTYYVQVREL